MIPLGLSSRDTVEAFIPNENWPLPLYVCDCGAEDARGTKAWCATCGILRVPYEVAPLRDPAAVERGRQA